MDADGISSETCGLPLLFEKSGASLILWALVYLWCIFNRFQEWSLELALVYVLGISFVFFNASGRELDMLIRTRHSSHSRMWSRLSSCFWVTK